MGNELTDILKTVKETTGIDAVAYSADGALLYRTTGCPASDFSFPRNQKDIVQPQGERITVVPIGDGSTVVLAGDGEAYRNYGALIRAALQGRSQPKKERTQAEKLRAYITGEAEEDERRELCEKFADPFDCHVLTLVTDSAGKLRELTNFLQTMQERGDLIVPYDTCAVAYIKKCGAEDEYRSAADFAGILYDNIKEELRINVTVNVGGTVHSFRDIPLCFGRCLRAYAFGRMQTPLEHIYSYKEFILLEMLNDIPASSLSKYLATLCDRDSAEILDDPELMQTSEEFLKNSLNISETSRSMFMHRNTLIYRLDKIEKATGLNLRHFNDAVAFRLLTALDKLVKANNE